MNYRPTCGQLLLEYLVRSVKIVCPVYEQVFDLSAEYGLRRSAAYTRNCNKRVKHMYLTI